MQRGYGEGLKGEDKGEWTFGREYKGRERFEEGGRGIALRECAGIQNQGINKLDRREDGGTPTR